MENEIIETTATLPTEVKARIEEMIANRKHIVEEVRPMLIPNVDIYSLPGMNKPSLGKPGAEKLAAIFGLRASFRADTETVEMIGKQANGKQYVAYVCTLSHNGQFAGEGRGATFVEWERTNYKNVNPAEFVEIRDALAPDDYQEKQGKFGKYYRVKDGTVFDNLALNKAVKMAQKSAFVDAVIRTTGMSDLFTQDLEDMRDSAADESTGTNRAGQSDEPHEYAPGDGSKNCASCGKQFVPKFDWAKDCFDCYKAKKSNA